MASASSSRASAPGSLMVLGEHAVLHGRRALACAVNRRITVVLEPRTDREVLLNSNLGSLRTHLDALKPVGPFRFILAALGQAALEMGMTVQVESEFSDQVGLGSSAAVTVATVAAVNAVRGLNPSAYALHGQCLEVIHAVQGVGSGTDAAASVLGGLVAYRAAPREMHAIPGQHPIALIYCGFKTPTVEVVGYVDRRRRENPEFFDALFNEIDRSVEEAVAALEREDWPELGAILKANQGYMEQVGVSNEELDEVLAALHASPGVLGAKISGSGLGDCALALGTLGAWRLPYERIDVQISDQGVRID